MADTQGLTITDLEQKTEVTDNDNFAIDTGAVTNKVTAKQIKNYMEPTFVKKAGDTMTGALKVPTADLSVADTTAVNREWADWWCNEFLCCPASWVCIDGRWFPCTIEPEEEVEIYDRTEESLISITFTMRLDFSGGFRNLL